MQRKSLEKALLSLLSPSQVSFEPEQLEIYGQDWTRFKKPRPCGLVFPETTEQIVQLIQLANEQQLSVVPSGGRTGLSGGAGAYQGELLVSLEKMNRILHFDPIDRMVQVQAGVITQEVQQFAKSKGLFYPVDFGAKGSSQIGGNVATNAGGLKVFRYGLTRNWVTGLKVVSGKGEILDLNKGLIKNASGYDLRHLFIGSEGTLGIIAEVILQLTDPPENPNVLLLAIEKMEFVPQILERFRQAVALSAFEFLSHPALQKVLEYARLSAPFPEASSYYILLEFDDTGNAMEQAFQALEACYEKGWVKAEKIAQTEQEISLFWKYREDISTAIAQYTPYKNDISVRPSQIPAFLQQAQAVISNTYPHYEILWYGHIADGNLHINILKPDELDTKAFENECGKVSEMLFEVVRSFNGSVSAEHGVGVLKKDYLHYTRSQTETEYLKSIKNAFDPNGIMNPGKILD